MTVLTIKIIKAVVLAFILWGLFSLNQYWYKRQDTKKGKTLYILSLAMIIIFIATVIIMRFR